MLQIEPFLAQFGLKRVDVPDDGHCLVSCVRLFFREYLPNVPDQTIAMLRDKFHRLNLRDAFYLEGGIDEEQFNEHEREFFEEALFDNQFMDIFTGFRDQLFNIKIILIMEREQTVMVARSRMTNGDEHNHYPDHTILLLRDRRAHYQLLVPANRQILSTITRFNRNTGIGGDIVELEAEEPEPAAEATSSARTPVVRKPPQARAPPKAKSKRRKRPPITDSGTRKRNKEIQQRYRDKLTPAQKNIQARRRRLADAAQRRREKEKMAEFFIAFVYDDFDEEHELYREKDLGPMNIECTSCGALHWEAERTGKSTNFSMCCEKGKVSLPPLQDPPEDLAAMFKDKNDPMHEEMIKNVIMYNVNFSTASAVADTVVFRGGNGPPVYKIHGVMIRRMSCLETAEGKRPSHGQYFMLDGETAHNERINNPVNHDCKPEVRTLSLDISIRIKW